MMMSISKPVRRSQSARVEAFGTKLLAASTITLNSHSKSYRYPTTDHDHQDIHADHDQIINSGSNIIKSSSLYNNKSQVWDCGSSLYDSFELHSLNLQLDLAMNGRNSSSRSTATLSMPPNNNALYSSKVEKHQLVDVPFYKKKYSLNKILRSVFGSSSKGAAVLVNKNNNDDTTTTSSSPFTKVKTTSSGIRRRNGSLYVDYDGSKSMRVLTTIPEVDQEIMDDGHLKLSPDVSRAVRRTVSERFTAVPTSVRV